MLGSHLVEIRVKAPDKGVYAKSQAGVRGSRRHLAQVEAGLVALGVAGKIEHLGMGADGKGQKCREYNQFFHHVALFSAVKIIKNLERH